MTRFAQHVKVCLDKKTLKRLRRASGALGLYKDADLIRLAIERELPGIELNGRKPLAANSNEEKLT